MKNKRGIFKSFELYAKSVFETAPTCLSDILPQKGAGRDCGAMTSLAPFGVNSFVPSKRQGIVG
jgi:hypothetical protein